MKFIFLCMGLGEYSQAESFAKFASSKGAECLFLFAETLDVDTYVKAASKSGIKFKTTKNSEETEKLICEYNPDVLLLCNSKTSRDFIKKRPKIKNLFVGSLDSNWTYNNCGKMFKVYSWVDNFFAVMPKKVFDNGCVEHGGHFKIGKKMLDKIYCPGFIPSGISFSQEEKDRARKELKIKKGEKLIYIYFGRGATFTWRWFLLPIVICVFNALYKENKNFRVFYVGKNKICQPWAISVNWVDDVGRLENIIAASDLVVQHHGLGTLPRVIHYGVPVICLTPKIFLNMPHYIASYYFEVEAFAKLGLCINMQFVSPFNLYLANVKSLLFDNKKRKEMIKKQKEIFSSGEENLYKFILKKINKK